MSGKRILWYANRELTDSEITMLKDAFGEDSEIIQAHTTKIKHKRKCWKHVLEAGKDCDILAVILPSDTLTILTDPSCNTKPVIIPIVDNRFIGENTTVKPVSETTCWAKVVRVDIITEPLDVLTPLA